MTDWQGHGAFGLKRRAPAQGSCVHPGWLKSAGYTVCSCETRYITCDSTRLLVVLECEVQVEARLSIGSTYYGAYICPFPSPPIPVQFSEAPLCEKPFMVPPVAES
jgi:hypothetical protein